MESKYNPLLLPTTISTLIHHRSTKPHVSAAETMHAIKRVGQSVNLAVERFVTVGETIADDNPEIKLDMYEACKEARAAGISIERLCEITATDPLGYPPPDGHLADRSAMIRSARALLSSVTRVLLLADIVVVKQLLLAKDKVNKSLGRLESVASFTEFVRAFSVFGAEMVELAHVTGDRQNDMKDERRRVQMAAARQVLERSTMMLLTSSKTCLRHPECSSARENRDTVFCQMRRAMDLIHFVVKDGVLDNRSSSSGHMSPRGTTPPHKVNDWISEGSTAYAALKSFSRLLEVYRLRYDESFGPYNTYRSTTGGGSTDISSSNKKSSTSSIPTSSPYNKDISANGSTYSNRSSRALAEDREFVDSRKDLMRSNSTRDRHHMMHHGHHYHPHHHHPHHHPHIRDNNKPYATIDRDVQHSQEFSITTFSAESREHLMTALDIVVEKTQDFTDSAYISHENRENILLLCDRVRLELNKCLRIAVSMDSKYSSNPNYDLDAALDSVLSATHDLSQHLARSVADQQNELHHTIKLAVDFVNNFISAAINEEVDRLQEYGERFHDCFDHILDSCKLLRHIALTETLQIQAKFAEINVRIYGPQVATASRILCSYPSSKIAKENLKVFIEMWQWLAKDVTTISKDIVESALATADRGYLSLPRPGKHGTTTKPVKTVRLTDEPEEIPKSEMDIKMEQEAAAAAAAGEGTSEELDPEKWAEANDDNNDILKLAKAMQAMSFSMHQFTMGEGTLRTTQDLFTQAEYFAEEANRLYKIVRQFSYQVPAGDNKKELLEQLDKVPTYVQSLQFTVKDHTVGKAATFTKVDNVIKETKNLMAGIDKVVTTCFECANK
ncbi:CTNNAL1 family protein [Megaselia abdita]